MIEIKAEEEDVQKYLATELAKVRRGLPRGIREWILHGLAKNVDGT